MKKLNRFISKHLANITFVIMFTFIIASLIIIGVNAGVKINWIRTIIFCSLLLCDWIYLIRCWIKFEHKL